MAGTCFNQEVHRRLRPEAERFDRLMQHQQAISRKRLERKVGSNEPVIIDEVSPPHGANPHTANGAAELRVTEARTPSEADVAAAQPSITNMLLRVRPPAQKEDNETP